MKFADFLWILVLALLEVHFRQNSARGQWMESVSRAGYLNEV